VLEVVRFTRNFGLVVIKSLPVLRRIAKMTNPKALVYHVLDFTIAGSARFLR